MLIHIVRQKISLLGEQMVLIVSLTVLMILTYRGGCTAVRQHITRYSTMHPDDFLINVLHKVSMTTVYVPRFIPKID